MELQEAIRTRRSVRQFTDEKVPHALLEQAVELAAWAPSWKNTQISRYIAIEDPEVLAGICAHYVPDFNARIIGGCKTLVVQTFVKSRSGFERDGSYTTDREAGWQYYDCGIAAQTFSLAAHQLGLGSVILGIFDRRGLEEYLQVPEGQEIMALIPVGFPAAPNGAAPKRKGVEDLLSYR